MTPRELLTKLKINNPGYWEGDTYIVDIDSDLDWGKINSKLDQGVTDGILEAQDDGGVEEDGAVIFYSDVEEGHLLTLTADFESDSYRLMIEDFPA